MKCYEFPVTRIDVIHHDDDDDGDDADDDDDVSYGFRMTQVWLP